MGKYVVAAVVVVCLASVNSLHASFVKKADILHKRTLPLYKQYNHLLHVAYWGVQVVESLSLLQKADVYTYIPYEDIGVKMQAYKDIARFEYCHAKDGSYHKVRSIMEAGEKVRRYVQMHPLVLGGVKDGEHCAIQDERKRFFMLPAWKKYKKQVFSLKQRVEREAKKELFFSSCVIENKVCSGIFLLPLVQSAVSVNHEK